MSKVFEILTPMTVFLIVICSSSLLFVESNPVSTHAVGKPAAPGCDTRPVCPNPVDGPCENGTFFVDSCWPQVFYECANGWPVPKVCPDPLVFIPNSLGGGACQLSNAVDVKYCGCADSCAVPPTCPTPTTPAPAPQKVQLEGVQLKHNFKDHTPMHSVAAQHASDDVELTSVEEEPCVGARLLPHACDCQFYWECDELGYAHIKTCGEHSVFVPRDELSGTCVAVSPKYSENSACTRKEAFILFHPIAPSELPVAPAPLPIQHPILDLLSHALKSNELLPHLAQYTKKQTYYATL